MSLIHKVNILGFLNSTVFMVYTCNDLKLFRIILVVMDTHFFSFQRKPLHPLKERPDAKNTRWIPEYQMQAGGMLKDVKMSRTT